jgi:hypothetical protein
VRLLYLFFLLPSHPHFPSSLFFLLLLSSSLISFRLLPLLSIFFLLPHFPLLPPLSLLSLLPPFLSLPSSRYVTPPLERPVVGTYLEASSFSARFGSITRFVALIHTSAISPSTYSHNYKFPTTQVLLRDYSPLIASCVRFDTIGHLMLALELLADMTRKRSAPRTEHASAEMNALMTSSPASQNRASSPLSRSTRTSSCSTHSRFPPLSQPRALSHSVLPLILMICFPQRKYPPAQMFQVLRAMRETVLRVEPDTFDAISTPHLRSVCAMGAIAHILLLLLQTVGSRRARKRRGNRGPRLNRPSLPS